MADPYRELRTIASLTRQHGLLVLSTGDVTGPLARRDLQTWNLMSPPYHLYFFAPATIDRLLAAVGFRLRRIVYDGVVREHGVLASGPFRRAATVLGLGNVMTVYAVKTAEPVGPQTALGRGLARYRPLGLLRSRS
jgi:hypothetical protein